MNFIEGFTIGAIAVIIIFFFGGSDQLGVAKELCNSIGEELKFVKSSNEIQCQKTLIKIETFEKETISIINSKTIIQNGDEEK